MKQTLQNHVVSFTRKRQFNRFLQRLSVTRALRRFFSHFEKLRLVDVNQMHPWQ